MHNSHKYPFKSNDLSFNTCTACTFVLAIRCAPPPEIPNATWNYSSLYPNASEERESFYYGENITYTCDQGYALNNSKSREKYTCLSNGTEGLWVPAHHHVSGCIGLWRKL